MSTAISTPLPSIDDLVAKTGCTQKQARFAMEYVADFNATQAWIRAGYSPNRADASASRALGIARVQAAVAIVRDALSKRVAITAEDVLAQYKRLGWSNPKNLFKPDGTPKPIHEIDDDTAQAIAAIEIEERNGEAKVTKIKMIDRKGAVDSVARCLGMFKDDKAAGDVGVAVKVYLGFDPDREIVT